MDRSFPNKASYRDDLIYRRLITTIVLDHALIYTSDRNEKQIKARNDIYAFTTKKVYVLIDWLKEATNPSQMYSICHEIWGIQIYVKSNYTKFDQMIEKGINIYHIKDINYDDNLMS